MAQQDYLDGDTGWAYDNPEPPPQDDTQALLDQLNAVNPGWIIDENGQLVNPSLQQQQQEQPLTEQYQPNDSGLSRGLDYWASQGVNPNGEIFDMDGQLMPGWAHTANGYEQVGNTPDDSVQPPNDNGWFNTNAPSNNRSVPEYRAPTPFGETFTARERPDYLRGEYKAPLWEEKFNAPTMDEVQGAAGYRTRMMAGVNSREAAAASRGSLLSGGQLKALERYGQEFGANEYANEYGRRYGEYTGRYNQFNDMAARDLQSRGVNESAYQADVGNDYNQYLTRFNAYQANMLNNRNAETDYWSRLNDLSGNGLQALSLGRPS